MYYSLKTISLLALLLAHSAWASTSLVEQLKGEPISIQADSLKLEQNTNQATYTGQVKITQGKLSIAADQVLLNTDSDQQLLRLEALSELANGVIFNSGYTENLINATATRIILEVDTDWLELQGKPAQIQRQGQLIEASQIRLNLQTQELQAEGSTTNRARLKINTPINTKPTQTTSP